MAPGHVVIRRAVGSDRSRLIAAGEACSTLEPSGHDRWPWRVRRWLVHASRRLRDAPGIADIGQTAAGLRVFVEIDERSGLEAVRLVDERRSGSRAPRPPTGDEVAPR
jgi:hypothetical protein